MRRLVGPCVLSLVCGCYLFSDEPRARKQSGTSDADPEASAEAGQGEAGQGEAGLGETGDATPAGECPKFLTGTETSARTIASSCGSVRVRGQYRIDGGSLTVEPGVELRFETNAVLE